MTTRVEYIESHFRTNRGPRAPRREKVSQAASQRIKRYCLGRLARDLEVRNCLKSVANNTKYPSAAACAADVNIKLERLD